MPIKLYADFISPDGGVALVTQPKLIHYNKIMMNRGPDSSPIHSAGKFICFTALRPDGLVVMAIFDYRATTQDVGSILEAFNEDPELKTRYTSLIELVNSQYESVKDLYELIQGWPPDLLKD